MSKIGVYKGRDGLVRLQNDLGRFFDTLAKDVSKDVEQIARIYSDEARTEVLNKGLVWHEDLYIRLGQINKIDKNRVEINIPRYGFMVAKMKPHFVSLAPEYWTYSKEPLKEWVEEKGLPKYGITVHPHDWIEPTKIRARARLEAFAQFSKVIRSARKTFKGGGTS